MFKKLIPSLTTLIFLICFASCQSDKSHSEDEYNEIIENDSLDTLSDSMIKSDKEKSDSILKYYQDKANQSDETPTE